MFETKKSPDEIVELKNLTQVSDKNEIENIIQNILEENQKEVEEYKKGKTYLLGFFVGRAMKLS